MLGEVSVLILIHQYIFEEFLIVASDIGVIAQQKICIDEDIVEIHSVGALASHAILFIYLSRGRTLRPPVSLVILPDEHVLVGICQFILCVGDYVADSGGLVLFLIQSKFLHDSLHKRS